MHRLEVRVYYEDTDAAGIVYYASYLRFLERGRTELLREIGFEQQQLAASGVAFAVRSIGVEYLKPARLDDILSVRTRIQSAGRAQIRFDQSISRNGYERLVDAKIRVACIDLARGKPSAMPKGIQQKVQLLLDEKATGISA